MRSNEGSGGGVGNCSLCCSRAKYHRCCSYLCHLSPITRYSCSGLLCMYVCTYVRMCVCVCGGGGGEAEQSNKSKSRALKKRGKKERMGPIKCQLRFSGD